VIRLLAAAVTFLLLSSPAAGGVEFRFQTTKSGDPPIEFSGTGWMDGGELRMELDHGNHPFFRTGAVLIHQNRGAIIAVLDTESRTYFLRTTERMRGTLSTFNAPWQVGAFDVSVRLRARNEHPVIAGVQTRKHQIDIAYTIGMLVEDTAIKARVRAHGELWLSQVDVGGAIPFGLHYALKTGFPEVDRRISRLLSGRGLPMRQVVTASRSIDGAPEIEETMVVEVESVKINDLPSSLFHVDSAYRYREPSVTLPERDE
jgi:hypothetical protein